MFQSDYFLKKHGIVLDTSKSVEEQILQITVGVGVQDSVSDDRPYIFISYAHKDSAVVLPAIKALQDKGYPVWYDAGIRPGTTWSDYIADHVRNAVLVIAFMSENAIASPHCQSEIRYAFNKGRPMLTVMLDQSQMPSGLDMQLSQWQMFTAYLYDGDTYLTKLAEDGFIASTAGAALNAYNMQKRKQEEEIEKRRREAEEEDRRRRELETRLEDTLTQLRKTEVQLENMKIMLDIKQGAEDIPEYIQIARAKLASLYEHAKENMYSRTIEGYKEAIWICNQSMARCVEQYPALEHDMKHYQGSIYEWLYRDGCSFEKSLKLGVAYEVFAMVPEGYGDVKSRQSIVLKMAREQCEIRMGIAAVLYYLIHIYLLAEKEFGAGVMFWDILGLYTLPIGIYISVVSVRISKLYGAVFSLGCHKFLLTTVWTTAIVCALTDIFLYPEMPIWIKILLSVILNIVVGAIGSLPWIFRNK